MAEHPILFSAAMVKAILEGRKTQTRRLCKLNPAYVERWKDEPKERWAVECPYGQPGDELWVRETFGVRADPKHLVEYAADYDLSSPHNEGCWKPSIHMPRWASRIQLVIRDVRVQRLQEIEEADARAEGVEVTVRENGALEPFRRLWDSLNSKRAPWSSNPWVWAITFERKA